MAVALFQANKADKLIAVQVTPLDIFMDSKGYFQPKFSEGSQTDSIHYRGNQNQ